MGCLIKNIHPCSQSLEETLFLRFQHLGNTLLLLGDTGVGFAHHAHQIGHQFVEKRGLFAQLVAVADGAADDAALHVAAPFVAGHDAVAHQKRSRADVVGNHAQALVAQIGAPRLARGSFDKGVENVDFVIAVHVLQNGGQTLQTHAGVDARCGQLDQTAISLHVKLHEHVVPNFNKAVAVFIGAAWRAAGDLRAVVVKNLAARAAGAGVGHHPEVVRGVFFAFVVANADDAVGRQANLVMPDVIGFLVVNVDGDQQFVSRQAIDLRQQLPAPFERIALEIVAKAPITQHFKEGVVACGVTHVFQIVVLAARTQARLHTGCSHIGAFVQTQKHVLELHHARVGEHQRGVVARHQGA